MSRLLCKYEKYLFIERIDEINQFKYWYQRINGKVLSIIVQYLNEETEWRFELNHENKWCIETDIFERLEIHQPRYNSFNQLVLGIMWRLNSPKTIAEDHSLLLLEDFDRGEKIHEF